MNNTEKVQTSVLPSDVAVKLERAIDLIKEKIAKKKEENSVAVNKVEE